MQKNIYFISDFHLGAPNAEASLVREKKVVAFLQQVQPQCEALFLLGDVFDFWFEYKTVVPKGFTRLLGVLAQYADAGIPIHLWVGNHDMWMKDYFEKEFNATVYYEPKAFTLQGKQFLIGHGDGLGPGDKGYKFIKKVFRNPVCKAMFGFLHPSLGMAIANYFSRKSRAKTGNTDEVFLGEDKEWLVIYCKEILQHKHYDYFVFGHRHLPLTISLTPNSQYLNLGDWIKYFTYGELNNGQLVLKKYEVL
jgi:UDP-2,3-diacylglucosamine hydrolase